MPAPDSLHEDRSDLEPTVELAYAPTRTVSDEATIQLDLSSQATTQLDVAGAGESVSGAAQPVVEDPLQQLREAIDHNDGAADMTGTAMRLFVSELDHRMLYDQALAVTLELLNLSAGMLFLYDEERRVATLRAQRGITDGVADMFRVCKVGTQSEDVLSQCINDRRMISISAGQPDALADAAQALQIEDLSALAARPLFMGKELIGVLLVCARKGRWALIGQNLARFHALADALAVAVGHEKLYTQKLEQVTTELISALSHEFRTPLTSILGYAEVLSDGDAGEMTDEQLTYLKIIESSAKRLHRQVENLLVLSRLQEGSMPFTPMPLKLHEAVANVLTFLGPRTDIHDLHIHTSVPETLPQVQADARAVDQIIFHLLDNALKFTPPGGSIYVRGLRSSDHPDEVAVSVMNTGASIPETEQASLFSAFYKTTASAEDVTQGAGVGLTIVRGLVERNGGRIWVESARDAGTTFYFTLPVASR